MYFSSSLLFPFSVLGLDPSASAVFKSLNRIPFSAVGAVGPSINFCLLFFSFLFFSRDTARCYEKIIFRSSVPSLLRQEKNTFYLPLWPQVIQIMAFFNHREVPTIILPTTTATATTTTTTTITTIRTRRLAMALAPPSLGTMNRQAIPSTFRKPRMPLLRLSSDGGKRHWC